MCKGLCLVEPCVCFSFFGGGFYYNPKGGPENLWEPLITLLRCALLLLFPPVSLSQRDCSSVDCPPLENCIKEAPESDGCCASCLQKGCRCEGYQRYDCTRAGFKNGIVPEGQSYFVDYGSTECSCPVGGGPISCRYIGCPDLPPNCIETLEPEDGCQQCERIGCVHRGEKYEAGHSFHVEACRICHCPDEGGKLMCYPDPDCDPQLTLITDDNAPNGRDGFFTRFDQLSASYNRPSSGNLPHFIPLFFFPFISLRVNVTIFLLSACFNYAWSLCLSVVEQQCCLSHVKESRCDSGVAAARAGRACEADGNDSCADEYQVCCSCCAIGLLIRSEGQGCNAHKYLSYPCGHIFLSCCEDEEGQSQSPLWTQEKSRPTALPRPGSNVDECQGNTHSCRPNQRCVNTPGSFLCELQVRCPVGYQMKNGVCQDIDECIGNTHSCGESSVCQNTAGSFRCSSKLKCVSGFTLDSHGNCIDINECSSLSEPCTAGSACINTVGSYTCRQKILMCNEGYHSSADGTKCVDTDECQMGTHRCGAGQICRNLPGSYRCDCQTGYQYDAFRKVCTDINECWRFPGRLCAQTCENTKGSYRCSCTTGFSLALDGNNCEDVNECDGSPCSQECVNIYGSYQCYCREGYYLKEDRHTCEDIDECSQTIGNLCVFQCVNVVGSYRCSCPPHGYVTAANGRSCKDIDECMTGSHNCSFSQTCYNLQGSFKCLSFDCPQNYKKVSDTHCERMGCPPNSIDCQNSPLRITYHQLNLKTNTITPGQIFRIGPSPVYSGDNIVISIVKGNEGGYFSARKLNSFTGAVYLQRKVGDPKDFLIDVEMKLLRKGTFTSFLSRLYIFITSNKM
uniref:Fibulin 2 n=1 Tax=Xiphophorus couchianus TaxID=32473 RepID=A0A3B5LM48_9TELE